MQNILEQAGLCKTKLILANQRDISVRMTASHFGDVSVHIWCTGSPAEGVSDNSPYWVSSRIIPEDKPVFQVDSFVQKPFCWAITVWCWAQKLINKSCSPCLVRGRGPGRHSSRRVERGVLQRHCCILQDVTRNSPGLGRRAGGMERIRKLSYWKKENLKGHGIL